MMEKKKVLVIDDNFVNINILTKILSEDYEVIQAENGKIAFEKLEEYQLDIIAIMLDLVMPEMDGYQFLTKISKIKEYNNTPIIVTTGESSVNDEIKVLSMGAWDFITKPYNPLIIKFRLQNAISRSQLSMLPKLKHAVEHDPLTNLYNRNKFFEVTQKLIDDNPNQKFALIRFDIQNFRLINSFYGQEEGDLFLLKIANQIRTNLNNKENVTFGHAGADVFCFCVPFVSKELIIQSIESSRDTIRDYRHDFEIAPNFGVYIIDDFRSDVSKMFEYTIIASKKCKGSYVLAYAFYEEGMNKAIEQEQFILNSMNKALDNKQFVVYYQPKFNLKTNLPFGAEALVRWFHPEKGMIYPNDFIPVFENNGFINKLDYYVWEEVCKTIAYWKENNKPLYPISVNVSRSNLYNPNLCDLLVGLIKKYDISCDLLNLEITETAYTENTFIIEQAVIKLQKAGFVIMMDDFGSGYSSLNILKDISFDVLKIDMKFMPISINTKAERILASVIRMAKWLNLEVIAEGVETKEQISLLEGLGCDYIQGYYFSKPVPLNEYEELLVYNYSENPIKENDVDALKILDYVYGSSSEYNILFKSTIQPMAIFEYSNKELNVVKVNPTFEQLFGYSDDSNLNIEEIINDDYRKIIFETFENTNKDKPVGECQYLRFINDGKYKWIDLKIQFISAVGDRKLFLCSLQDFTEQKELSIKFAEIQRKQNVARSKHKYMLIIDDQEINLTVLSEMFKDSYNILVADNGVTGLELMREYSNNIAVVLLDLIMPKMSGQEVIVIKNKDENIKDIPVVVISADSKEDVQLDAISKGVNDYVTKPFVPQVVKRRVNNVVELYINKAI